MASPSAAAANAIIKEGWGVKQGGSVKSWKKRWFVLSERSLAYYADERKSSLKGAIDINDAVGARRLDALEDKNNLMALEAVDGDKDRTYFVSFDSTPLRDDWVEAVAQWIRKREASKAGRILILGGTGRIGSNVARRLLTTGADITVATRRRVKAAALEARGANVIEFDYSNPDLVRGFDRILLVTPFDGHQSERATALIRAADAAKVKQIVKISGIKATADSELDVLRQHNTGDELLRRSSIPEWTILQSNFFMENYFVAHAFSIAHENRFYANSGTGKTSYVAVDDVASCAVACLLNPGAHNKQTYTLTGPDSLKEFDCGDIITQVLGHRVSYIDVTPDRRLAALRAFGMPEWIAETVTALDEWKKTGAVAEVTNTVERILGRNPISFRELMQHSASKKFVRPRILVVGSSGQVGQPATRQLLARNAVVRIGVRDPQKAAELRQLGAEVVRMDLDDRRSIATAMEGVAHVLFIPPFADRTEDGGKNLVDAAEDAGVQHFVKVSVMGAAANHTHNTMRQHGVVDDYLMRSTIPTWNILKPGFFFQNILSQAAVIRSTNKYYVNNGLNTKGYYIDAGDVAEASAKLALLGGFNIWGNRQMQLSEPSNPTEEEVSKWLTEIVGHRIEAVDMDEPSRIRALEQAGLPHWVAVAVAGFDDIRRRNAYPQPTDDLESILARPPNNYRQFLLDNAAQFQDLSKIKFLVLGASGNIGGRVARRLLSLGAHVRVGVRSAAKAHDLRAAGADVVEMSLEDKHSLGHAVNGINRLFFLVPQGDERSMVEAGHNLIESARAAGVSHVVKLSGLGASAASPISVGRKHGAVDDELKRQIASWTLVAPTNFQENYANYHEQTIKNADSIFQCTDQGACALVAADDVADVIVEALVNPAKHRGQVYSLTGPQALTSDEVAAIISDVAGRRITFQKQNPEERRRALASFHVPEWMITDVVELETVQRDGHTKNVLSTVQDVLGRPAIPFKQTAQALASHWRK